MSLNGLGERGEARSATSRPALHWAALVVAAARVREGTEGGCATPSCHKAPQNTQPPVHPKSRLYLPSLVDVRTECLK